jgi:gamma-glutamylcyclotransferase (GGCT)/AIG2-like uncharacterized protein YtfP
MYYFAYGSNMDLGQMKERCPSAKFLKKVLLSNYKLVYDGHSEMRNGAVGNIVPSKVDVVWGALFEVDQECIESLDEYEGFPGAYQKSTFMVADENGSEYQAMAYHREGKPISEPSPEYRALLIQGAKEIDLPKNYIKKYLI